MKTYLIRNSGGLKEFCLRSLMYGCWAAGLVWFRFTFVDWINDTRGHQMLYALMAFITLILLDYPDHFFIRRLVEVRLDEEGVEAKWGTPWSIFTGGRKKILWEQINSYKRDSTGGVAILVVKTKSGMTYKIWRACSPLFIKEKDNYFEFFEDFEARYKEAYNKGLVAEKPEEIKSYSENDLPNFPDI